MTKCEARRMDIELYDGWKDPLYPCEEPGTVEVAGYFLCECCAATLEFIQSVGPRIVEEDT